MSFTSFDFFVFLPVAILLYWLVPQRFRWGFLLLSGIAFYSVFSLSCLAVLIVVILINYFFTLLLFRKNGEVNKTVYRGAIILNILALAFFKYAGVLADGTGRIRHFFHLSWPEPVFKIILPLGFSFFIFSFLSYLVDVKRKKIGVEQHLGILSAYFLFFPKIMQGPIERAGNVIPQIREPHTLRFEDFSHGLRLILWGYFKKLVVADNLASYVNYIYGDSSHMQSLPLMVASVFFALQIYADFSGYTDIAVGSARLMGIRIMPNFRAPYLATSIKDFWNRWHISFSQWLRDYLFLPLAYAVSSKMPKERYWGVKTDNWIYLAATTVTFFVCGIWHGIGWTYVIWGLLFAFYLCFALFTAKSRKRINRRVGLQKRPGLLKLLQVITTFILVIFAWIFFRSESPGQACGIIRQVFTGWSVGGIESGYIQLLDAGFRNGTLLVVLGFSILLIYLADILQEKKDLMLRLDRSSAWLRYTIYAVLLITILVYSASSYTQFIYTQY